ncbi:MAG: hypothetical protein ABI923_12500 [bacterium]
MKACSLTVHAGTVEAEDVGALVNGCLNVMRYLKMLPGTGSNVSIEGGEPAQITNKFADLPAVSPDGKLIACYLFDEQTKATKLALLPFAGGDPIHLFDLPRSVDLRGAGGQAVRWTPDGRALTYIVNRGGVSNIWAQAIDGSAHKQLTDFKTDRIFSFDWSRDGKQLACSRGPVESDVVLISNFK